MRAFRLVFPDISMATRDASREASPRFHRGKDFRGRFPRFQFRRLSRRPWFRDEPPSFRPRSSHRRLGSYFRHPALRRCPALGFHFGFPEPSASAIPQSAKQAQGLGLARPPTRRSRTKQPAKTGGRYGQAFVPGRFVLILRRFLCIGEKQKVDGLRDARDGMEMQALLDHVSSRICGNFAVVFPRVENVSPGWKDRGGGLQLGIDALDARDGTSVVAAFHLAGRSHRPRILPREVLCQSDRECQSPALADNLARPAEIEPGDDGGQI